MVSRISAINSINPFLLGHFLGYTDLETTCLARKRSANFREFIFEQRPTGKSKMNDRCLGIHKLDIRISAAGRNLATQRVVE